MFRILLFLLTFIAASARGEVTAPAVSTAQLDAAVARATAITPEDDAKRAALLKFYADTRTALAQFDQFKLQIEEYSAARVQAVKEAGDLEAKLAKAHVGAEKEYHVSSSLALSELEQMIQIDKSELDARRVQLADTRAAIDAMPQRPAEVRNRVTELTALASRLQAQIGAKGKTTVSGSTEEADLWLASAQLANVNAEKAALEEELLSQPMRLELLKVQLDQATFDIVQLEKRLQATTQRAGELREDEATTLQLAADQALTGAEGKPDVVLQLAQRNVELSKSFSARTENIEQASEQDADFRRLTEQLETDLSSIEQKLQLLGMSSVVGEILRERQAQLLGHGELTKKISANEGDIRASSLRQVELEEERRLLRSRSDYIESLVVGLDPAVVEQVRDDLNRLVRSRRDLVRKAIELENTYAQSLGDLDYALRRYQMATDAYREFISERLLWIPSRDKFGVFHGGQVELFKQVREVFAPDRWLTVLGNMPEEVLQQPYTGVMLVAVLVLFYYNFHLRKRLVETGKHVGYVRSDNFSNTMQAAGITVLMSLRWPLLLLTAAWLFEMQDTESELATALYLSSLRTALYFWCLEILRVAHLPKGLMDAHFRWAGSHVAQLHKRIVALEMTLLPGVFFVNFFLNLYPRTAGGPLGTITVILVLISIAWFFYTVPEFFQKKVHMLFGDRVRNDNPLWGRVARKLLFWIPVAAIVAVMLGYSYTAIEISLLFFRTFVVLGTVVIVHELGLRWLSVTRRRMAFAVRQEQLKTISQEGEPGVDDEVAENDPDLFNYEGTRLLNLLTLFGGLLGVAWVWQEIFPALGILDSVELWQQSAVVDGNEITSFVTLADIFRALVFATVGWIALRRIPSLLEIFLRQKLDFTAASSYAITRVFQYATTMLLVIFVMGSLGVSWSSLQWAVAALSLGIGFGLQEIVANFISGLIILFEQPIRVGDTVTVGDVSGTVTRIQMRATTIRDYDRRELLVPNKQFITSQLLNWSLSDTVTRRLIQVGVDYSTDVDQVIGIVLEIAKRHPLVMVDPPPTVTFDDFGQNGLLISLRYFIEDLEQRSKTDSELRLEINHRLKEAGVTLSAPQRGIKFDTAQPIEIRMLDPDPARAR